MSYAKALAQIQSELGTDALLDLEQTGSHPSVSTGSILVDYVTGIGGLPYGRITEIYGLESVGKSTLAWQAAANCQRDKTRQNGTGGRVLFLDYEHATDLRYVRRLGVQMDKNHLVISQPHDFEEGMRIAQLLLDNSAIDMMILDSVAALVSRSEMDPDTDMTAMQIGQHARTVTQAIKRINARFAEQNCCAVWINQLRTKINMNRPATEETTGGKALKFFCSMRLELRKTGAVKGNQIHRLTGQKSEGIIAMKVRCVCVKNKLASPFNTADLMISFGEGFDEVYSLKEMGAAMGKLKVGRMGHISLVDGTALARGIIDLKAKCKQEPKYLQLLRKVVLGDDGLKTLLEYADSNMEVVEEVEPEVEPVSTSEVQQAIDEAIEDVAGTEGEEI